MEKLRISNISKNIFRTAPNKVESNHTNPFGVSFKGNVLTADVFEVKKDNVSFTGNIASKVATKSKMLTSAIVGSINNMNSAITTRLNSIAEFGSRIKRNISDFWQYANSKNITESISELRDSLKTEISWDGNRLRLTENQSRKKKLQAHDVTHLSNLLEQEMIAQNIAVNV